MRVHLFHKLSGFQSINKAAREYSDRRAYPIDGDTSPPPPNSLLPLEHCGLYKSYLCPCLTSKYYFSTST